jgi:putative FmdB family regulatory protein
MPIYEYECQTCGKRFEELMRLSDPDPTECPCGKQQPVRRALTAPAFRLSGSGWYETDFKKDGDKKRNLTGGDGGDNAKPAETGGSDSAKAEPAKETAPAKPAETKPATGSGTTTPGT